jgi:hypothetical protein
VGLNVFGDRAWDGPNLDAIALHLLVDGRGVPLSLVVTGANRHDVTQLQAVLDGIAIKRIPPQRGATSICALMRGTSVRLLWQSSNNTATSHTSKGAARGKGAQAQTRAQGQTMDC